MPRRPRLCPPEIPQHVIQRGHDRRNCFRHERDFAAYAALLRAAAQRWEVAVHAWVFMSNHVHLLMTPAREGGISRLMHQLGSNYVRYFNQRNGRSGTLWEDRFRSCLVQDDEYLLQCHRYIELNPLRAGMVAHPAEYPWSSYRSNANGVPSSLLTPHPTYLALGDECTRRQRYRAIFDTRNPVPMDERIRESTRAGLALGSPEFRQAMERITGQRLRPGRPGRPRLDDNDV